MSPRSPVSIVIPCYNAERTLPSTLESVFAQRRRPLEVICVDDGSTDRTLSVLVQYLPRIKVVCHPNHEHRGDRLTRDLGAEVCRSPFIAFVAPGDVWPPERLEREEERLKKQTGGGRRALAMGRSG